MDARIGLREQFRFGVRDSRAGHGAKRRNELEENGFFPPSLLCFEEEEEQQFTDLVFQKEDDPVSTEGVARGHWEDMTNREEDSGREKEERRKREEVAEK